MWHIGSLTILSQVVIFITAVAGFVKAWQGKKLSAENGAKLIDIHLTMNSRLDELIKASRAQGRQEERDSHQITVQGVPQRQDEHDRS
jgi:hypothetical protein